MYIKLRNPKLKFLIFNISHLNKYPQSDIEIGKLSIYDVSINQIVHSHRKLVNTAIRDGYSILFQHGGKTKILWYNS